VLIDEYIVKAIQDTSVALVIATYLVYWVTRKLDKKIDLIINSIDRLSKSIEKLINSTTEKCRCGEENG